MSQMGATSNSNSYFWTLFSSVCVPLTIPWLLYKFLKDMQVRRRYSSLAGKVVLITGASSGLGEALAHAFYERGCRVILAARRKEELERVKQDLMKSHATVLTYPPIVVPLDLTDINSLQGHVQSVLQIYEQIDILINNGGIGSRGSIVETNVDLDIKVMLTNYFGQVALTKAVLPSMIKKGSGHIVAISSVQGKIALPHRSAYSASKHALQAFCDSLRAEVASKGIKVTVVSPGYVKTQISLNAITEGGQKHGVMEKDIANGYPPEYIAKEIVYAVVAGSPEVVTAQLDARVAIYLRTLFPSLFFWIMKRRADQRSLSFQNN